MFWVVVALLYFVLAAVAPSILGLFVNRARPDFGTLSLSLRIVFAVLHGLLRCIDVDELRSRVTEKQGSDACVAEQVQHVGVGCTLSHPVPLGRHVREEAEVPERRQRRMKPNVAAQEFPLARDRPVLDPAPTAFLVRTWDERRIRVPIRLGRCPHRLRLGTNDAMATVTLEFLAIARVDQAPVGPGLGNDRLEIAHAANASAAPTDATATGPSSNPRPAARASTTLTERM